MSPLYYWYPCPNCIAHCNYLPCGNCRQDLGCNINCIHCDFFGAPCSTCLTEIISKLRDSLRYRSIIF